MRSANAERRQRLEGFEKNATRVGVGLVIAAPVLGIGAGMIGAAEIYPFEYATTVSLIAALAPIGLALLLGAVGGLYIMGGWKIAPFGVVFVAGFAALVYGIVMADARWRLVGVGLLAISGVAFYLAGVLSERVPAAALNTWGSSGAVIGGAVIAVVGYRVGNWAVLLFGGMAVGCGTGGLLGRWWIGRRKVA